MIAKGTVVAKLSCHDLDDPPNAIRYAPSSGPVGSGQLYELVPKAENLIRVRTGDCNSRELSQGDERHFVVIGGMVLVDAGRGAVTAEGTSELLHCLAGRHLDESFVILLSAVIFSLL